GAFTFGGSLSIIPLIQEQIVHQLGWLTPQEFIDGLALGQLTPGPPVMLAAYVGYKALGALGVIIAAMAVFLPSFAMMFALLPCSSGFVGSPGRARRCREWSPVSSGCWPSRSPASRRTRSSTGSPARCSLVPSGCSSSGAPHRSGWLPVVRCWASCGDASPRRGAWERGRARRSHHVVGQPLGNDGTGRPEIHRPAARGS